MKFIPIVYLNGTNKQRVSKVINLANPWSTNAKFYVKETTLVRLKIYFYEVDELITISSNISTLIRIKNKDKIYTNTLANLNEEHKLVTYNIWNQDGQYLEF